MTRSTAICVARHGETDWNSAGILQGWIDVPLNETGRRQAAEMAEALRRHGFARVSTSPLMRAAETADIIAARLELAPPERHDGLKERHFGLIQGMPKAELARTHPELMQGIADRNPAAVFEQGETPQHFAGRVLGAIREIAATGPGERVLVITHGWVMDAITRHIRGLPIDALLNMKRKNGECLWLQVQAERIAAAEPA
jgi:probable phosphoglycerate mutase